MNISADLLRKKIREELNRHADYLAEGRPVDWGEYRKAVGVIEGLAVAERLLLDMTEEVKKQNLDDGDNDNG